jgi:hypothetical protein
MITLLTFNSLGQSNDIDRLLEKPETRNEIFYSILDNHELMTEFMKTMKETDQATTMMENENHQISGMDAKNVTLELESNQQMSMMKDDPKKMQTMISDMMEMCEKDPAMQSKMVDMMAQHPEMMNKCMQKMQENGMLEKDGNMKMMDSESAKEGEEHSH